MKMTLVEMQKQLQMEKIPEQWRAIYEGIKDTWQQDAEKILSDSYISEEISFAGCMKSNLNEILSCAKAVRENSALCLLVCLLHHWVVDGGNVMDADYTPPKAGTAEMAFLHLYPAIPTLRNSVQFLRQRNVPEDVIADTMAEYDYCLKFCQDSMGYPAFNRGRLHWICCVIHNRLIRVGQLKYDMPRHFVSGVKVYENKAQEKLVLSEGLTVHQSGRILGSAGAEDAEGSFLANLTETEGEITGYPVVNGLVKKEPITISKEEWHLYIDSQDLFLRIHIPVGSSFDTESLEKTYIRTRQVMADCFPDYPYKGFYCTSWLMSADLRDILKPDSNILKFQEKFVRLPFQSSGKGLFSFVFGTSPDVDYTTLPEKTSLQRKAKEIYLNGGYIHEGAGFFL